MRSLPIAEKQWLFTRDQLAQTPSQVDGISHEKELAQRAQTFKYACSLSLRVLGIMEATEVSAAHGRARGTLALVSVLIHRFYMRRSLADFKPELIAPTILFIASKVEEEALKLRYIVNACLAKFEGAHAIPWDPSSPAPPSLEYNRWEKEILAVEEIAQEALCFDMTAIHPWTIVQRATVGLDERWALSPGLAATEAIEEVADQILRAVACYPIGVLYHPSIIAFMAFAMALTMIGMISLEEGYACAAEISAAFGLDIEWSDTGAKGADMDTVRACVDDLVAFSTVETLASRLIREMIDATAIGETSIREKARHETPKKFTRYFKDPRKRAATPDETGKSSANNGVNATANGATNGHDKKRAKAGPSGAPKGQAEHGIEGGAGPDSEAAKGVAHDHLQENERKTVETQSASATSSTNNIVPPTPGPDAAETTVQTEEEGEVPQGAPTPP